MYLPDIYSVIKRKENKNRAKKPCYIEYMYYIMLAKSELFRKYFCLLHEIRNLSTTPDVVRSLMEYQ